VDIPIAIDSVDYYASLTVDIVGRCIPVGDAARSYGLSLTFRRKRFVVRLVAYQNTPGVEAALIALARGIDARLVL